MIRIKYVLVVLFLTQHLQAQEILSRIQAEKDAKALEKMILKVHPAPDAYISKDSFRHLVRQMLAFEGNHIAVKDWEVRVRHALLPIGCGHTYMAKGNKSSKKEKRVHYNLPFRVFTQNERTWVIGGVDSLQTDISPAGSELLAIGERPAAQVAAHLRKHQPSDGFNTSFQKRVINRDLFYNYLFSKYYSADSIQYITWAEPNGVQHYQKVQCIKDDDMVPLKTPRDTSIKILHQMKQRKQYFYMHPQNKDIGVLKINTFSGRNGAKFYKKVMKDLKVQKTPYLVVDLRDNTGGSFASSTSLIRYTTNKKFSMTLSRRLFRSWHNQPLTNHIGKLSTFIAFDLLYWGKRWIRGGKMHYKLKFKPIKKDHYNGQVFILVNGMSFSASSQTATFIKAQSDAVIIGTETGGGSRAINGMQIPVFKLPESKFLIHIPQMHLDYKMGKDMGQGVMPHIPTEYTVEDMLARRDLDWEAVMQWIATDKK